MMNLVITVRRRSALWRNLREWWYELMHGCAQLPFIRHDGTGEMGSNHEGIFTSRSARRESEEIEVVIYSWNRRSMLSGPETAQLVKQIEEFSKKLDYDNVSTRYRNPD